VSEWGIDDKVEFTGYYEDVAPILEATHIVVQPSLLEARPQAVLEAMAWGRPVVASRTGGLPELIEDQVSGLLVPPADTQALAQALGQLTRDPERRRRMGLAARRKFLVSGHSAENMVRQTLAIYQQVARIEENPCASTC
jgi:glycosyltransferase involved in cell wall biosynthesis